MRNRRRPGLTQVFDGNVVAGSVDVSPVDVRHTFTVADHVTADHVTFFRCQPGHHHRVGERTSAHVRRFTWHRRLCTDTVIWRFVDIPPGRIIQEKVLSTMSTSYVYCMPKNTRGDYCHFASCVCVLHFIVDS